MIEFEKFDRSELIKKWLKGLDGSVRGLINKQLDKYEYDGVLPNTAGLLKGADGIGEMRFDFGPGYRVYFFQHGKVIILLLYGGIKKTQDADILVARNLKQPEIKRLERELRQCKEGGENGAV